MKERDMLNPAVINAYGVVAIGPNSLGQMAIYLYSNTTGHPLSRAEAEQQLTQVRNTRPDIWTPSMRWEVWKIGDYADAIDNGTYAKFIWP